MPRLSAIASLSLYVLAVAIACTTNVLAGDVAVDVFVATGPREPPMDVMPADTAKLYVLFKTHGVTRGDKFRGVLYADNAGRIAPRSKVTEANTTLNGDTEDGGITFNRPPNGWPPGDYHIEIYINNQLTAAVKFRFEIPKPPGKS